MALSSAEIVSPDYNVTDKEWKHIFSFHQVQTDQCKATVMTYTGGPCLNTKG